MKHMCTRPNYMVFKGQFTINDKPKLSFLGHHQYKRMVESELLVGIPFIQVPCGKCLECRIQHARNWADRCVLEAKQYKDNYFVTLTYDDEYLPPKASLEPKDLQLFMKRLRRRFKGVKIRFLACGEYGDSSMRPHYHIILFNCPLDDLSYVFQKMENGKLVNHLRPNNKNDLMFSKTIYECWQNKGMISVGRFNYDTAAYVSQYVTKKCNPKMDEVYKELGLVPEFLRMSNRPGIGAQFFDDNDDIHAIGNIIVPSDGEAHVANIPRYYDKLFVKKYGEAIFSHYQKNRLEKKFERDETYLHSNKNAEREAKYRDHNLKKRQHYRAQL